jgi:6-phosphogluconolactonase
VTELPTTDVEVVVHEDKQLLSDATAARLVTALVDAQAARGVAHLVLTGGSMGSLVLTSVTASPACRAVDWSRVHLWWGDERCLPDGDDERNEKQCLDALLAGVTIPAEHIHAVAPTDSAAGHSAEAAAADYAARLASAAADGEPTPVFDVLLLGVGPDGHIASLFPGHPGLSATGVATVAVHDSPKPPPDRVSLTFETLNRAREVWFLVAGDDKADAVARGTVGDDVQRTPAAGVHGRERTLWLLDRGAAAQVA